MLAFIAATRVTFCIVHKLDRLARNRADDVKIHEALINAGVTLVSATESIDQTPSGMLVHGIMSSIAEFYSRNLATEVTKGLSQKVAQGGTPMRAPIGYLNVRRTDDQGREIRTVEVDPERAPLIAWAFEQYAKGETSVTGLLRDLTARGLLTVPTPKRPSKALGKNTLYKLLTNPYYAGRDPLQGRAASRRARAHRGASAVRPGAIAVEGAQREDDPARPARPPPQRAAALRHLRVTDAAGLRHQPARHTYAYFICSGRAAKKTTCTRRAVPVAVAERLVADSYANITISDTTTSHSPPMLMPRSTSACRAGIRKSPTSWQIGSASKVKSDKLLAAHFADAIDLDTLKRHQDRIRAGLADVNRASPSTTSTTPAGARSSTTRCGCSPTRTAPTPTPATPTGGSRTRRSTRASTSPTTNNSAHASPNRSPPSSTKRTRQRRRRQGSETGTLHIFRCRVFP